MIREKKLSRKAFENLPQLIERFREAPFVKAMYLIGSLVHGPIKPLSDLDFAVLLSKELNLKQLFQEQLELIGLACDL
ncbi:MAG: nucleotidyltransferase domain-containing protein [Desulfoferrobacter sp.]